MRQSQLHLHGLLWLCCFFLGQLLARGGFGRVISWLCPVLFPGAQRSCLDDFPMLGAEEEGGEPPHSSTL